MCVICSVEQTIKLLSNFVYQRPYFTFRKKKKRFKMPIVHFGGFNVIPLYIADFG